MARKSRKSHLSPQQRRSAIADFVKDAGPYIRRVLLKFGSDLVTEPLLAAGKGLQRAGQKAIFEPALSGIYNALGIPEEKELRNSLTRYVYRDMNAAEGTGEDELEPGYRIQPFAEGNPRQEVAYPFMPNNNRQSLL